MLIISENLCILYPEIYENFIRKFMNILSGNNPEIFG